MRRAQLSIIAAMVAAPAALHAQPKDDGAEIECIYHRAAPADLEVAWSMERAPRAPNAIESAAMDRDASAARACATLHGWPDSRTVIALTYAMARAGYDRAVGDLGNFGLAPDFIEQVAADLGERGLTALANGDTANGNGEFVGATVARSLQRAHAPIQSGSPELEEVARIIARGLHAKMIGDQAVAAFAAP